MRIFLIGCAFLLLLVVGCAGTTSSESSKKEGKGHTDATEEQAPSERCEETRTIEDKYPSSASASASAVLFTTNDLSGCAKGGLLSGTDKRDTLNGFDGDDEIRGLAGPDFILGGVGNDVIYAGPGDDEGKNEYSGRNVMGNRGDDVLYGGDGNDTLGLAMGQDEGEDVYHGEGGNDGIFADGDRQPDKLYCGKGKDRYIAEKIDYVDSSCEKKMNAPVE